MAELEIEGKTVEEAIKNGLDKLGVSKDKVKIKILNEGANGLFGLMGSKPAKVMITAEGIEFNDGIDYELSKTKAKKTVTEILKLMGFSLEKLDITSGDGAVLCNVKSADSSLLIGKNGQTLDSLEHIVNLIVNRNAETRVKINLDTEDYKLHQEQRLKELALKACDEVRTTGKAYRFEPMSAKDRRIIHVTLKDTEGVETFSEGEGMFRKVAIKPKK